MLYDDCLFFFFKQKTAYEMRISDWSSDVCSSDLHRLINKNKNIYIKDLGLKDYKETWDYQEMLFRETLDIKIKNRREDCHLKTPNHFLFVEHHHVYTLGKSGKIDHLLVDESQLAAKGAKFYKINRGGDITYHGPGQYVGYPIIDIDNFFTDINKLFR